VSRSLAQLPASVVRSVQGGTVARAVLTVLYCDEWSFVRVKSMYIEP